MNQDKYKYSVETAKLELQKLFDYYEIDIDEIEDAAIRDAVKLGQDRLIKAVRLGRIEIDVAENDDGTGGIRVKQILKSNGSTITYKEIDGNAKTAMAGKKADDNYGKSYALMGALSGWGESAIKNLKGVDLSLVEVLGLIFLSV